MTSNIADSSSVTIEEENLMNSDSVYHTNGEPSATTHTIPKADSKADALLLYQAKQNVNDKKNLQRHLVAFIAMWPVLVVFYNTIVNNITNPLWRGIQPAINHLQQGMGYWRNQDYVWAAEEIIANMEWHFVHAYTHFIWYVILGMMLAWGCWIAVRVAKHISKPIKQRLRAIASKKPRPDPVILEYNRLKSMATDNAM